MQDTNRSKMILGHGFHLADPSGCDLDRPVLPEQDLSLAALSPVVLAASLHDSRNRKVRLQQEKQTLPRLVHSYEIELFTRTGGIAVIDDCQFPITRGDIRFHRPGQIVWSCLHYECYGLRLSLDGTCPPVDQDQPLIHHPYLDIIPPFMSVASPDHYFNLFDEILRLSINPPPGGELLLKARVLELLYRLYADALQLCTIGPPGRMTDTLTRAMDFIAARYKEPLRLSDIARSVNLSPHHFHRLFTRAVTLTPLAYLTKVRIERAREQLLTGQDPIADIALACGFENQSYFAKVFRQQTGVTPGQFRRHRLSID